MFIFVSLQYISILIKIKAKEQSLTGRLSLQAGVRENYADVHGQICDNLSPTDPGVNGAKEDTVRQNVLVELVPFHLG